MPDLDGLINEGVGHRGLLGDDADGVLEDLSLADCHAAMLGQRSVRGARQSPGGLLFGRGWNSTPGLTRTRNGGAMCSSTPSLIFSSVTSSSRGSPGSPTSPDAAEHPDFAPGRALILRPETGQPVRPERDRGLELGGVRASRSPARCHHP
jgi:hypothetical protein